MTEALIFDAVRTPRGRGRADGSLHEVNPVSLLAGLMRDFQRRLDLDTAQVEDALIGCVQPHGEQGAVIAKLAALAAGWDWRVPGLQLNRYCGSGLEATNLAAAKVRSGWQDLIVAGGVESMSRVAMGASPSARDNNPALNFQLRLVPQGVSADLMATLDGHTREQLDAYALLSQQRAAAARAEGRFAKSIIPVTDLLGQVLLAEDELIRADTTLEGLGALKPSFAAMGAAGYDQLAMAAYPQLGSIEHRHTPGNSSGIVDGAALILVGSERKGRELNLTPRARIVSVAATAGEPVIMLDAPAPAARIALAKAGLRPEDIDLYEINEAFATVVMRFMQELHLPHEKVNVNGGAIAMGHPLGATGCMLVGTVLDELERRHLKRGMVVLCAADGMGVATIVERL